MRHIPLGRAALRSRCFSVLGTLAQVHDALVMSPYGRHEEPRHKHYEKHLKVTKDLRTVRTLCTNENL